MDWLPLIVFYALQGSVPFTENCLIPTICGFVAILFSYLRNQVDPIVIFPKVLDVGFVVIFLVLTIICYAGGGSAQYLLGIWSNALMNGFLALIMYLSCVVNRPFVLAYAIEAGLPPQYATQPIILYGMKKGTMEWTYAVGLMAIVSCVAPMYLCASNKDGCYGIQNDTYNTLNLIFTNAVQYAILGYMLYKYMYLEPKKRQEGEAWTFRRSEEIQAAYGVPPRKVSTGKGKTKVDVELLTGVNPLIRDQWGAPLTDKLIEEKLKRASIVIARAFLDDPMIMKWPQIGTYPAEKRLKACERLFGMIIRAGSVYNHTYFIDNGSYCVGIPCWEKGNEHDIYFGPHVTRLLKWDLPFPPVELAMIREMTNAALQGRKHLHITLFSTDPSKQGKGYGSACMRMMLDVADKKGVVTSLETMTNKNRKIYEHYGFRVVGSLDVEGCTDPWYSMIRDIQNGTNNYEV